MGRFLLLALAALVACGGESPPSDPRVTVSHDSGPPELAPITFSAIPALLERTELAAARWSAATCRDVRVGDSGLPVEFVDPVADGLIGENGETAGGGVYRYEETGACAKIGLVAEHVTDQIVAHEMGHCLGQPGHTDDGLMSPYADGLINAASLALVCEVFACACRVPEF